MRDCVKIGNGGFGYSAVILGQNWLNWTEPPETELLWVDLKLTENESKLNWSNWNWKVTEKIELNWSEPNLNLTETEVICTISENNWTELKLNWTETELKMGYLKIIELNWKKGNWNWNWNWFKLNIIELNWTDLK